MASKQTAVTPTRAENFSEWYQEVIKVADLAEHSPVRGCMIIKPWGYGVWENIQKILDGMIKETGHENVYFPLLIPLSFLEKEAAHIEGFAKECAVVTHYRLEGDGQGKLIPSPDAKLTEPFIIRPTSETIIGTAMAKWVQSYNDLPVLINQWCNIMRWEMRTRLFLRTSEFLWQEGHTAHASAEEAMQETMTMLDVYEKLAREYLALPVIRGEKTAGERFPGAVNTYCIETMMQDGKALQAGTSHFLGQNFSKAYDISFSNQNQQIEQAWTTSWGVSTRLIGALIMTHSDDDGLVLPPRIAPEQIILIPVANSEADMAEVLQYCNDLAKELKKIQYHEAPIRVGIDKSNKRGGEKFWGAVKKGIPLRIEIGKREIEANVLSLSRRDKAAKDKVSIDRSALFQQIASLLDDIQNNLFQRALDYRQKHTKVIKTLAELDTFFGKDENKQSGFAIAHFDLSIENDPMVDKKFKELKLSIRCIPFDQNSETGDCIFSGKKTATKVIIARAY
jgi:prolyl-tRNA synthetase